MEETARSDGPLRAAAFVVVLMAIASLARFDEGERGGFSEAARLRISGAGGGESPDRARGTGGKPGSEEPRDEAAIRASGSQKRIGQSATTTSELSSLISRGRIELNRAGREELMALPGIGPAMATRILSDRAENGFYARPEDLMRVKGIGPKTFERIAPYLSVEPFPGPKGEVPSEAVP